MAFLVCYSDSIADHTEDKAIYLDQQFYELIFRHIRNDSTGFTVMRQIALLRYKSPSILISTTQLPALIVELEVLDNSCPQHPQIHEFKSVCQNAIQKDTNLTISGDMYPELDG